KFEPMHFVLVFSQPVEIGSMSWAGGFTSLSVLKPEAASIDALAENTWLPVEVPGGQGGAPLVALPPKTMVRAIRLSEQKQPWNSTLNMLRFFKPRLANVTPLAHPFADSEATVFSPFGPPFTYAAERVTTGVGEWINVGKNKTGNIAR